MEDLAASISVNTKVVVEELKAGGHVLSPDDMKTPGFFPLLRPEGAKAQMELISSLEKLLRLATGPWGYLSHLVASSAGLGTLRALVNLHVPQSIPLNGTIAVADLARKATVSDELLTRLIRYSITNGFLEHAEEGYVRHSVLSAIFAPENGWADAADCISWELNVFYPSTVKMYESLLLDPTGTDDTKTPLSLAFATKDPKSYQGSKVGNSIVSKHKESNYDVGNGIDDDMTLWKYHLEHPEQEAKYHNAMTAASKSAPLSPVHAIYGFDWNRVKSVVDVGGSAGTASIVISNAFPHIKFTVQDIGSPITSGINSHPNITYLEHDFFTPQPTIADVYFLRQILHNWSDENCKKIVQNLLPALRSGSQVIVMDIAIKDSQKSKISNQRVECQNHNTDVIMWTLMGAKERTEKDFVELICGVEPRLKFEGSKTPDGCLLSVLVWRFEE